YLGKKFLQDFVEDNVETGEIYRLIKDKETIHSALYAIEGFIDDGWQVDGQYDCFYVKNNEAEGCMHLQYYFYSEGVSEEQTKGKVLVIDVYLSELGIEHMRVNAFCVETEGGIACTPEETESQEEKLTDEYPYIDYDYIEQYHEILFHNITTAPKDDYDDTVLAEYLKEDIEKDKELLKNGSGEERPLTIAYHVFDFNDDGLEDYLVCLEGTFWRYDDKNTVRIYMQEQNGTLREVFTGYVYFCRPDNQPPVAVLAERVEGCHSLALPGPDSLLRYDKERGQYEFCEVESNAEEENVADEIHVGMNEEEYAEKKEMYENIKRINMSVYIDYEFIEAKHEILRHNIISEPKDANENVLLKEALKDDMEDAQQMYEKGIISSPLYIDYFPFDFNDDGLEDYLVCYHGSGWSGTAGNHVCIYIQENDGTLSSVFSITMRLYDYVSRYDHSPLAILDEKDDGYYAFVLVGNNRIIRYNKEEKKYQFEDEN
ncbi:MAG: hypothetical protein K2H40_00200, partial [Lachnospiraceae bacterium]|nr:hypothetical protein [Lachnospiraceae bacterium]